MSTFAPSATPNVSGYPQSQILAVSDFVRPDFQTKLFKQYGQFTKELLLLKRMQATRPIVNASGGFHFEEDFYDALITVKADVATSGATLSFTLADSEIDTINGIRTSYPNVGDLIYDPVTMVRGRITTKTDNGTNTTITATVIVTGETWDVPTAGKQFGIYSNAYAENTDQPEARSSYWDKFTFQLQKIKTSALITGDAATDKLYPETDEKGNFVGNWGGVQRTQAEFRHLKAQIGQLILGTQNTASGVPSTTNGMMATFAARANGVDIAAGADITAINALIDALKPNNPDNNFQGWLTRNVNRPLQESLHDYFKDANIAAVRRQSAEMIFGSGENVENEFATFDFQTVVKEGMTFNLRSFDLSYDPKVFGINAANNQFCSTAYFMPSGRAMDAQGNSRNFVELAYAENGDNGQSRMLKIWETGANAPTPTNTRDNRETHYLSHWGLDFFSIKQCGFFYNSSLS